MSGKKKPTRRRIKVGGEEVSDQPKEKPKTFSEAFKLDAELPADEGAPLDTHTYHPDHVAKFMMGQMTLGDLEGITKQQQYQIAQIGHGYLSSGKLPEAQKVFEGLLALDPYDAYFNLALGSIAQQKEDFEAAEKLYSRALEINPFSPTAYANRGEIRVMSGRLAEGAQDLVRAVKEDPGGKEPATIRAKATIAVLKEQLGAVDVSQLESRAKEATASKVKAAQAAAKKAQPRPRPRARPRPRPRGRPAARRPGPKKKR